MKKETIVVINRWNDPVCNYQIFIDHDKYNIVYIVNENGYKAIRNIKNKYHYQIEDLAIESCIPIMNDIVTKYGSIKSLIALSEIDIELAAGLRSQFQIEGMDLSTVRRFRDKVVMKVILMANNIRTPQFYDLSRYDHMSALTHSTKFPLILKPKCGVSSEGVIKIKNHAELHKYVNTVAWRDYECEEFINGRIFHADGIVDDDAIAFIKVSEYINTCLEYTYGKPLGSVILDSNSDLKKFEEYTAKILSALDLTSGAFHLEFILKGNDIYFLEIGARVGGAGVAKLMSELFNINLYHCWIDQQLGSGIKQHLMRVKTGVVGGWLLFPEPRQIPSIVTGRNELKSHELNIIDEYVPDIGHVFRGNGEYRDTSGSYILDGKASLDVKNAMLGIIENFKLHTQPLEILI